MSVKVSDLTQKATDYAKAWCSKDPEAVAAHYSPQGEITINRGEALAGRAAIAEMATGFHAEFPDLVIYCDDIRTAGDHAVFAWTLEGHHVKTGNHVKLGGWEEWELDDGMLVRTSKGWFDAKDYEAQIQGAA